MFARIYTEQNIVKKRPPRHGETRRRITKKAREQNVFCLDIIPIAVEEKKPNLILPPVVLHKEIQHKTYSRIYYKIPNTCNPALFLRLYFVTRPVPR